MTEEPAEIAARVLAEVVPRLGRVIAGAVDSDPEILLSLRQYRVLERLTERPHRMGELASASEISQPTASAAVTSLEGRGLVDRVPDPADGRASLIAITPQGQETLGRARERVRERLLIVTSGMSARQAADLRRLQPVLQAGMDDMRAHIRSATVKK